jgi:hypothetical protein
LEEDDAACTAGVVIGVVRVVGVGVGVVIDGVGGVDAGEVEVVVWVVETEFEGSEVGEEDRGVAVEEGVGVVGGGEDEGYRVEEGG